MSHGVQNVGIEDVPVIVTERLKGLSPVAKGVLYLVVALGLGALVMGVSGEHARRVWAAFHVNALFWLFLSAASACFTAVFQICNAQWARPIRRLFEAGSSFFTFAWIPFAVLYFVGGSELFVWFHEEIPGKGSWLNPTFVYARDIAGLILLAYLARRIINLSLARDIGAVRSGITGVPKEAAQHWFSPTYDSLVGSWKGDAKAEIRRLSDKMGMSAPVVVMVYALVMALVAFDQIMAVDPLWFSTLFGAFLFMSAVYCAVAWSAMSIGVYREVSPLYRAKFTRKVLWDLGKLLFGFGIFWAYLFWSHYITIWYGNLPEETGWIITRLRDEPWHTLAWMVLGMSFIYPFLFGLSRDVKQVPQLLFFTALIVTVGQFLMHYLLFVPTLFPKEIPLGIDALLITFGFGATYILATRRFLERYPLMPFGDLYLEEEHH